MQINALLPVLLQLLLSGEASRGNKSNHFQPPASEKQESRVQPNPAAPARYPQSHSASRRNTQPVGISYSSPGQLTTGKESIDPQGEFIFLPLPLKSEIFPEAKFYKQIIDRNEYQRDKGNNEEQYRIVLGLNTTGLGELCFLVWQKGNFLSVKCAASRSQTVQIIREKFPDLKESLARLGWDYVNLSCICVKNPGELPKTNLFGFVDRKI